MESLGFQIFVCDFQEVTSISESIKAHIQECDCLIALLTRRSRIEGTERYVCPQWLISEMTWAESYGMPIVVLVEDGVDLEGFPALQRFERFNRDLLIDCLPKITRYLLSAKDSLATNSTGIESKPATLVDGSTIFPTLTDARWKVFKIWQDLSQTDTLIVVKIIANTGTTILSMVNEYLSLYEETPNLHLKMLLINPESTVFDSVASHWRNECRHIMQTALPEFNRKWESYDRRIQFEWRTYEYLPPMVGLLIDERHLLIGWCSWRNIGKGKELRGAENPCLYFNSEDQNAESFFYLFNGWFNYGWGEQQKS